MVLNPIHHRIIGEVNFCTILKEDALQELTALASFPEPEILKAISECVQEGLIKRLEYMRKHEQTRRCIYYSSDIKLMF